MGACQYRFLVGFLSKKSLMIDYKGQNGAFYLRDVNQAYLCASTLPPPIRFYISHIPRSAPRGERTFQGFFSEQQK